MHKNRYLAGISIACTVVGTAAGISGVVAACMWDDKARKEAVAEQRKEMKTR